MAAVCRDLLGRVAAVSTPSLHTAAPATFGPRPHVRATPPRVVVYVAGEMVHGVVTLPASARIVDAFALAGNAKPGADLVAVNLAAPLHDGDEIVVPLRGAAITATPHPRALDSDDRAAVEQDTALRTSSRTARQSGE